MTPEWIVATTGIIQLVGFGLLTILVNKWKVDVLTAILDLKEWSDNKFITKELCIQKTNEKMFLISELKREIED
jgi:hypothetical protein